jgi:hypothetical protein
MLVIEKFLPEQKDGMYCLRQYTFLGKSEINTLAYSEEPIVKARSVTRREILAEPYPGLREIRREMAFDYGKFDYAVRDGGQAVSRMGTGGGRFAQRREKAWKQIWRQTGGLV